MPSCGNTTAHTLAGDRALPVLTMLDAQSDIPPAGLARMAGLFMPASASCVLWNPVVEMVSEADGQDVVGQRHRGSLDLIVTQQRRVVKDSLGLGIT